MANQTWDVIVVGSGPGGLTAAACLAASGRSVLVLEQHDVAGGNATVFRRHPFAPGAVPGASAERLEYEFDVGVHYIGECGPGGLFPVIFTSLGMGQRMTFRPFDQDGFDTLRYPGIEVRVPADWDEYTERIVAAVPSDEAGIRRCLATLRTVAEQSRTRMLPGAETPEFDRWAFRHLSELYATNELSPRTVGLLSHWSGLYAGAPSHTAVIIQATIIDHYMHGAYYPEGGGQMIPARLAQVIEAHGGEIRTLAAVAEIRVERDPITNRPTVRGVTLTSGEQIDAAVVISNADHARTVRHLVPSEFWDPATLAFAEQATMTLGLVCVYIVVDIDLTDRPNTSYHVWPTFDVERCYATLDSGQMPDDTWVYIAFASIKDPDNARLCPPGHTNFQLMTLAPRGYVAWGISGDPADGDRYRRDDEYRRRKEAITERMIDAAEGVLGPFREHIVHVETATPLSHARYTSSTNGTSYGYQHSPEQSGINRPQHRAEIDGLWLTGANTASGHGIAGAMVGGVNCAGQLLDRPLLIEMFMGAVLADPESIPADELGADGTFDPLWFCRGAKLRQRRPPRSIR